MTKFSLIVVVWFSFTMFGYGQRKNERESKISKTVFPIAAQQTLSTLPEKAKRIKYYRETDGDNTSFECKFKLNHFWYSVEFDKVGKLEDIEVKVRRHQLSKSIRTAINNYLEQNSDKYDIIKIQEQYVQNTVSSDIEFLKSTVSNREKIASNYELIVALKKDNRWKLNEMTFDTSGVFIFYRELQTNSYEYIMH